MPERVLRGWRTFAFGMYTACLGAFATVGIRVNQSWTFTDLVTLGGFVLLFLTGWEILTRPTPARGDSAER